LLFNTIARVLPARSWFVWPDPPVVTNVVAA